MRTRDCCRLDEARAFTDSAALGGRGGLRRARWRLRRRGLVEVRGYGRRQLLCAAAGAAAATAIRKARGARA